MNRSLIRLAAVAGAATVLLLGARSTAGAAEGICGSAAPVFTADGSGVLKGELGGKAAKGCEYRVRTGPEGESRLHLGRDGAFVLAYDRGFGRADFVYEVTWAKGREIRTAVVVEEATLTAPSTAAGVAPSERDDASLKLAGLTGASALALGGGAVWLMRRRAA
ncbi:hypothetical protein Afil01_55510 [Actinorhabdospora filicis]|uniref:Gram-positive cocci surface proteins LPxTG domain-containing protein n=1 Tax=Actinorhabdospora filicis TaxID=1785913 RepID=A0A9W6SPT1_9ACTN|nr:hypothetical protein [Actinorhabdospora filicis]GLZ80744.1 hypothetical protein Afil01_55510 [Actinorhabdospora filicis]